MNNLQLEEDKVLLLISTNVLFLSYKNTQVTELTAIIRVVGPWRDFE